LAERAWEQIIECFNQWFFLKALEDSQRHSALFVALANLALKAWEARANTLRQSQPFVPLPDIMLQFRIYLSSWRSSRSEQTTCDSPLKGPGDLQSDACYKIYPNLLETNDSTDLSMPFGLVSPEDPLDWVFWKDLTLDYPRFGIGDSGGNGFDMA
jgi:hypothetical protein